jgi:hypothetical protein
MRVMAAYAAGVATGWMARSAFGSLREVSVGAMAAGFELSRRLQRLIATEQEFVEDLIAEARSRVGSGRARLRRAVPRVVA